MTDAAAPTRPAAKPAAPMSVLLFGSCISRDILPFAPDGSLALTGYFARSAMASAFASPPVRGVEPAGIDSAFQRRMVMADADKTLAAQLTQMRFDLLLHDPIDERFNLLRLPCGALLTRSPEYTKARDPLQGRATETIISGSPKFLALWEQGWRAFLAALDGAGRRDALRINRVFWSARTESGAGFGASFPEARIAAANAFLATLYDRMAADLAPTQFLRFDDGQMVAADSHQWGLSPFHYTEAWSRACVAQLLASARSVA